LVEHLEHFVDRCGLQFYGRPAAGASFLCFGG
jgi:hypothetical protein